MNPHFQVALQQAMQAFQSRNFEVAKSTLNAVLQSDINSAAAIFELGVTYAEESRFSESIIIFNCLESSDVGNPDISYNLGFLYAMQGDFEYALKSFEKAIKFRPNDLDFLINYASTLHELKRFDEALAVYEKVLTLKADDEVAFYNMANTLHELNRSDEALIYYDQALSIKPDYAEAYSNKAVALESLWRYDEALFFYDQALSIKPDYAEACSNKAVALEKLKRYDEAITYYEKALDLKSAIDWVSGDLLHTKMKICDWGNLADSLSNVSKRVMENERTAKSFPLLALSDDVLLHKKSAEIYIQSKYPFNPALGPILKRPEHQKIRVGYFSADFHNHATGYLIAELFELHDKSQFELVGFSFGPIANDEMRQRLKKSFDQFIEIGKKSDIEVAKLSRDLNIDIAVDLKGFTQDARMGIFAHRAAPIQVNYLGYPGTLGADYIDYIIADKTLIPAALQSYYSEKVIYMPDCYQVNDSKRLISDRKFTRQELGLPEHGFVFCCFNNNYKILPATFDGWMRILKAVEGSILWLYQDNSWVVENLIKEAEKQGIAPDRLVFAERLPLPEHLARHRQADLFLDTFPCNAHTTTSDALWAGLPVLTLMGSSFASRVAASLLNTLGLSELTTSTQEGYESLAIELAMNPSKFADIKLKLANNRMTTPLFNTVCFTKNLEAAYVEMHRRYHAGLEPDHISIV